MPQKAAAVVEHLQQEGNTDLLQRHLDFMSAVTDTPLVTGNAVRLLVDGPASLKAMSDAIASAEDSVNLEMYMFQDDRYGRQFVEQLLAKQAQGVQVNLLYDSLGSALAQQGFFERLRTHGANVCEFNPLNPLKARASHPSHRDHRKLLVVDGVVAFTGGINISSEYMRSSFSLIRRRPTFDKNKEGWRDTQIEVRGPAVARFQQLFIDSWHKQKCHDIDARNYFPALTRQGDKLVRVLGTSPDDAENLIYLEMLSAIHHAGKSVHITMAYFVPDKSTIAALKGAAQRGVDVKLILPSATYLSVVFHAGRLHYAELMTAGVQIYERESAPLHAKTAVIDGVWSNVGSANMDWLSFLHNDEINAIVLGRSFGQEMESMFAADLSQSSRVDAGQWARRGLWPRLKEFGAGALQYWL